MRYAGQNREEALKYGIFRDSFPGHEPGETPGKNKKFFKGAQDL
jgi:hypothetical protein